MKWVDVRVEKLLDYSAFDNKVWGELNTPIRREEVEKAIAENRLLPECYSSSYGFSRQDHVERIAYLVVNKSVDLISIDVGIPSLGCARTWIVSDGNHRLAAAIYRGDETIPAEISGDVKYAAGLLGVEESLITGQTSQHQVESDGRTVWVNSGDTGMCLGRFGPVGIDIHHEAEEQIRTGEQCRLCSHTAPTPDDWQAFVGAMKDFYQVEVADHHKPKWLVSEKEAV